MRARAFFSAKMAAAVMNANQQERRTRKRPCVVKIEIYNRRIDKDEEVL